MLRLYNRVFGIPKNVTRRRNAVLFVRICLQSDLEEAMWSHHIFSSEEAIHARNTLWNGNAKESREFAQTLPVFKRPDKY